MKAKDIDPTMLRDIGAYEDYPFEALHGTALAAITRASSQLGKTERKNTPALMKALECFLQITNQSVIASELCSPKFHIICQEFLGALYSAKFISVGNQRRYAYAHTLLGLLKHIPDLFILDLNLSKLGPIDQDLYPKKCATCD